MDQDRTVYEPRDAARRLDLSDAGLRRLAPIYERVFGNLPRDGRRGRLWTDEAIYRLERARGMVQGGRAPSIEAALKFEDTGDDVDLYPVQRQPEDVGLAAVLEELRALRTAVEHQNQLLEEQGRRLEALEAPTPLTPEPLESRVSPSGDETNADTTTTSDESQTPTSRSSWWRRIFG